MQSQHLELQTSPSLSQMADQSFPSASAGVGRTGTLIALDVLLRQLECEGLVGPFSFVKKMRESRPLMVQTEVKSFRGQRGCGGRWETLQEAFLILCVLPRPSMCFSISAS